MDGHDFDVNVIPPPIRILVLDAGIRKMDLLVEVRQVVVTSPFLDLVWVTIGVAVVVVAVAIVLVEPLLVVALELVVENDAIDARPALVQALCFAFERSIDLDVVLQLPLAFDARVERLAAIAVAVTMALEQAAALLRQRNGVVARAGYSSCLHQPLPTEVAKVARSRISGTIVVVSEITTGDHSKRPDRCERARFRAAQFVLAISVTNDLAIASSRQVEVTREDLARVRTPVAVGPPRVFARIMRV
jgi:hypothetical protein